MVSRLYIYYSTSTLLYDFEGKLHGVSSLIQRRDTWDSSPLWRPVTDRSTRGSAETGIHVRPRFCGP